MCVLYLQQANDTWALARNWQVMSTASGQTSRNVVYNHLFYELHPPEEKQHTIYTSNVCPCNNAVRMNTHYIHLTTYDLNTSAAYISYC